MDMKDEVFRLVKRSVPADEIMRRLGIKTKSRLQTLYLEALADRKAIKPLISSRSGSGAREVKKKIGKRGTLTLSSKLLVESFGFQSGDEFVVKRRGEKIVLTKI